MKRTSVWFLCRSLFLMCHHQCALPTQIHTSKLFGEGTSSKPFVQVFFQHPTNKQTTSYACIMERTFVDSQLYYLLSRNAIHYRWHSIWSFFLSLRIAFLLTFHCCYLFILFGRFKVAICCFFYFIHSSSTWSFWNL